jgi:glutaredoxin
MMAKGLLNNRNIDYIEINIDKNDDAKAFILNEGHRNVPQLYNDSIHLASGYEGIQAYLKGTM